MGGGSSQNVAETIANVGNTITTTAGQDYSSIQSCRQTFESDGCQIQGNFTLQNVCNLQAQSKQILNQLNNGTLKTSIAQTLAQTATTTVGAMGIGYAAASNLASSISNISTAVSSAASQSASSVASISQNVSCHHMVVQGDVDIGQMGTSSFMNDQLLKNKQITDISNQITQSITQTASATVEGLTGLIIAVAILVIAIGYVIAKPATVILENRYIMITAVILILGIIVLIMYLREASPFFSIAPVCMPGSTLSSCGEGGDQCSGDPVRQTISLTQPPQRYLLPILGNGDITVGQDPAQFSAGLLQIFISAKGGWDGEHRGGGGDQVLRVASTALPGLPPPIKWDPDATWKKDNRGNPQDGAWVTNSTGPNSWSTLTDAQIPDARFWLAKALNFEVNMYIFPEELVASSTESPVRINTLPPEKVASYYLYRPSTSGYTLPKDMMAQLLYGGTMTGLFSQCQTRDLRVQQFMMQWGLILGGSAFGVFVLSLFLKGSPTK